MRQIRWYRHVSNAQMVIYYNWDEMPFRYQVIVEYRGKYDHEGD